MLDISLSTVKCVEKRMKNKESLKDHPRSGRPRAIDPAIVKTVFLKNPTMKMTELAKKKKISKSNFVILFVNHRINCKCFLIRKKDYSVSTTFNII